MLPPLNRVLVFAHQRSRRSKRPACTKVLATALSIVLAVTFSPAFATDVFPAREAPLAVNGYRWCNDDSGLLPAPSENLKAHSFSMVVPYQRKLTAAVALRCPHSYQIEAFARDVYGLDKVSDVDTNWPLIEIKAAPETESNRRVGRVLFSKHLSTFFSKTVSFEEMFNEIHLQPVLNGAFLAKLDLQRIYRKINSDPKYAQRSIRYALIINDNRKYDVGKEPPFVRIVAVPEEIGAPIMVLATILFLANSQTQGPLWADITSHLHTAGQHAVASATHVVAAEANELGIGSQTTNVDTTESDKDDRCAREIPNAKSEATTYIGQEPPSKRIILASNIKDKRYQGWEKWIYDYRKNGVFIQIHYMYNPNTQEYDQVKVSQCKVTE